MQENKIKKTSGAQAVINYCINKACPVLIIVGLIFTKFELTTWEPYVIIASVVFIDRFSFKVGYSVAYCESRGIDVNGQDYD